MAELHTTFINRLEQMGLNLQSLPRETYPRVYSHQAGHLPIETAAIISGSPLRALTAVLSVAGGVCKISTWMKPLELPSERWIVDEASPQLLELNNRMPAGRMSMRGLNPPTDSVTFFAETMFFWQTLIDTRFEVFSAEVNERLSGLDRMYAAADQIIASARRAPPRAE